MSLKKNKDLKLYFSISEVAQMFDVNESTLRFWEKEFDIINPRKTSKGTRFYKQEDIDAVRLIYHLVKERGMTLAGAVGNIIDSVFYGVIFNESTYSQIAHFVPVGEGYSEWFHGKVVDMFYFPIIETNWPEWIPGIGGEHFIFFSPIFNFADAAISCGIIALLLFYGKYLNTGIHPEEKAQKKDAQ